MEENNHDNLKIYPSLYFEHSDTCPSRRNRLVSLAKHEP